MTSTLLWIQYLPVFVRIGVALCETVHFIGLAMVVGVAGFFDLRLLGFFNRVPLSACKEFMPWASAWSPCDLVRSRR